MAHSAPTGLGNRDPSKQKLPIRWPILRPRFMGNKDPPLERHRNFQTAHSAPTGPGSRDFIVKGITDPSAHSAPTGHGKQRPFAWSRKELFTISTSLISTAHLTPRGAGWQGPSAYNSEGIVIVVNCCWEKKKVKEG